MKFVFLYTEIAEYFLACCNQLAEHGDVHIIRWPVNKEAPFKFETNPRLKLYSKTDYTLTQLQELVASIQPDVLICSGWIDKDYLKISKAYFKKIPTVMTCDTHWTGSLKQQLARVISRFTLMRIFSHAWVPGEIQETYATKLGFKSHHIHKGFYSCDLDFFNSVYSSQQAQKQVDFPKRFLYVGRYYEFKGIKELWQAFIKLQEEQASDWELWCLGVGDLEPVQHPKIKHFGFVQPKDLAHYTSQTGVFILPSRFEPWGVVVHEFAASGFPLLLSDKVGAKDTFLKEGSNGYSFEPDATTGIKEQMKKMIALTDAQLLEMGEASHRLAQSVSPAKWVNTLMKIAGKTGI
jgi:glycosyltransferase involved in cell wall biosynthesis